MRSFFSIAALVSSVFASYIPPQQRTPSGEPNATDHTFPTPSSRLTNRPHPHKGLNDSFTTTTTNIVYSTVITCPAGQPITSNGRTWVFTTDYVSTVWETVTKTVCPKCSKAGAVSASPTPGNGSRTGESSSRPPSTSNCPPISTSSVLNNATLTKISSVIPSSSIRPTTYLTTSSRALSSSSSSIKSSTTSSSCSLTISSSLSSTYSSIRPSTTSRIQSSTISSVRSSTTSITSSTTSASKSSTQPNQSSSSSGSQSGSKTSGTESKTTTRSTASGCPTASPSALPSCYFWMEDITHQGISAFGPSDYTVFRNVKDYGAKGDGVSDDTVAINAAISDGDRCAPGSCGSSTKTPAVVYFPAGTYLVSAPIIDFYYTQIIGNPNCVPTIKASGHFSGPWIIDGDPYQSGGSLGFGSTNVFWRQIRNFIIDLTSVSPSTALTGIHWPTAQATSLQNIVFKMSEASGTLHQGIFIESGSGGFMTDLIFYGGNIGANWGNQQFTMRNLTFYNAVTAINQIWDWGWTYKGITVDNCTIALNISGLNNGAQTVGSVIIIDSTISNTKIGVATARTLNNNNPSASGSMILENVLLENVGTAVQGSNGVTILEGGSSTIGGWGQGNSYTPNGPTVIQGGITPNTRPSGLTSGTAYYERSKPQYESYSTSSFFSARSYGAAGNGIKDDTAALQAAIDAAASCGSILYVDAGTYLVTDTITVPAGSRIVGESYSVIIGGGSTFSNMNNPVPVVQVGKTGDTGIVEWSDMIVSTQGAQAGAVLIEWNLAASSSAPAGMWDVHTRIGGFAGSNLQLAECPTTNTTTATSSNINVHCIAAFMSMHVTTSASGLYLENVWLWTADHDVEDPNLTQITVYTGRGLYIESISGNIWLYGAAAEHHSLYQFQLANTQNVYMGQIQTETPYYQPNPDATIPFPPVSLLNDPIFTATSGSNSANALGLRIVASTEILIYGAGLYSFYDNYDVNCSNQGNGEACQKRVFDDSTSAVSMYNLNTVGVTDMITVDNVDKALFSDNLNGFVDTIALFR